MKDWTPMNWIAYLSLGTCSILNAIGAAKETPALSSRLPSFVKIYILGFGPAICFIIASIFFIIQRAKSKKVAGLTQSTDVLPLSSQVIVHTTELVKPKKYYSDRNKSDLANALTDLYEIIENYGSKILKKAKYIVDIWRIPSNRISSHDINNLATELKFMHDLSNSFYEAIFIDNGFYKKYISYSDELCQILQINKIPSNTPNNPIPTFLVCINGFRNTLMTIQQAEKYNDKNLIIAMIANSMFAFDKYMNGIQVFKNWIEETRKRIDVFRNSLV